MIKTLYTTLFLLCLKTLTAQLNTAYSIGVMGENLNTLAMGYPILLESSDCFVASNSIIRFVKSSDGDFEFDCKDSKIEELIEKILEVKLYPNPAQEIVYIRLNTVVSNLNNFQIFYQDMNGIVLKKSTASIAELLNGFQEDISFLKSGLYIVSLISEDFVYKLKLLKK